MQKKTSRAVPSVADEIWTKHIIKNITSNVSITLHM